MYPYIRIVGYRTATHAVYSTRGAAPTVPRNSFARYDGRHLRIFLGSMLYLYGIFTLNSSLSTLAVIFHSAQAKTGEHLTVFPCFA